MPIVTQYSPRHREKVLKELPDQLFEFELNEQEAKKAMDLIPELKEWFDIRRLVDDNFDVKFSGKLTIKCFKKETNGC